jgi:hypothetical protein
MFEENSETYCRRLRSVWIGSSVLPGVEVPDALLDCGC